MSEKFVPKAYYVVRPGWFQRPEIRTAVPTEDGRAPNLESGRVLEGPIYDYTTACTALMWQELLDHYRARGVLLFGVAALFATVVWWGGV
jgi:hypothetical protein